MKCEGSSTSSHDVADTLKLTSEMMLETNKSKKTMFLDGMDAFDDFLQLVAPQSGNSTLRAAIQMEEGFVVNDDDASFFSDDSEDESSKNLRSRVTPERGMRRDHSGDLERLFQARHTITDKIGCDPPRQDKKQVIRGTVNGSKQSKNKEKKPTVREEVDHLTNSAPEQRKRTSSSTNLVDVGRAAPELSKYDNKASRMLSRHSAHDLNTKSDQSTGSRRRERRLTPPTSTMQPQANDVEAMADPICSVLQEMNRTESRLGSSLRRSRVDLSSSEHSSRPRLRRDTLYAAKRQPNSSGTSDNDRTRIARPSSEIDFQKAAAAAAKKRQSAGTRRIAGGTTASSLRESSSKESLRYSTANRNSSAELSDLSPPRLPRSNTSGTNLCRSTGSKRSLNNLKLDGVYSNAGSSSIRTVEDLRRSLRKNGGRSDIDDLVVKMTTRGGLLPTTNRGNATWN